jgi:hypothetical protein
MTHYLKDGNSFRVADDNSLDIHNLLPAGNYIVKQDMFGNFFLEQVESFTAPSKIYGDTLKLADRMLNTYHNRPASTGVLLTGEKGSGKTLLSKMLSIKAAETGVPTIIINSPWKGDGFNKLMQDISQPCVVLFDEFEKVYDGDDQEAILTLLDGVFITKKLFVLTCNDKWRIDSHMRNRPGRIYYMLDYTGLDTAFVREYCEDNLVDQTQTDAVCNAASLFTSFNFDMLKAMVEEMNRYGETPQEVLKFLNAKPEFMAADTFNVEAIIDNEIVKADDLSQNQWRGNPLREEVDICVRNVTSKATSPDEDDDYEWVDYSFTANNLKKVDGNKGRFVFTTDKGTVILTRVKPPTFDYWAAL